MDLRKPNEWRLATVPNKDDELYHLLEYRVEGLPTSVGNTVNGAYVRSNLGFYSERVTTVRGHPVPPMTGGGPSSPRSRACGDDPNRAICTARRHGGIKAEGSESRSERQAETTSG